MKRTSKILNAVIFFAAITTYVGCSKSDDPQPLDLVSILAGDKDLNGATFATGVAVNANIVAVFNTDVDAATATASAIVLKRGSDVVTAVISVDGKTVTLNPDGNFFRGTKYDLSIDATKLKSKEGKAFASSLATSFTTEGVGLSTAPQSTSQVLYIQFDNAVTDLTGNATKASEQVAYTTDRFGNENSAANFRGATAAGNGDIVELTGDKFFNASMTLSVWFKIKNSDYAAPGNKPLLGIAAGNGYFIELGDGDAGPGWIKPATSHLVSPDPQSHGIATAWNDFGTTDSEVALSTFFTDKWHHLVLTYDASTYLKDIYFDGTKIKEFSLLDATNNEWNLKDIKLNPGDGVVAKLALGYFCSKDNTSADWAIFSNSTASYKGFMDDLRLFSKSLTSTEVTALYNAEKP